MSKSLGNVISPYDLVKKYGTDATRYMLLRHVHPTEDTDVTWKRLDEWYTANLVNGLGNLVARVMKLAEDYLSPFAGDSIAGVSPFPGEYEDALDAFEFNKALDLIWEHIARIDERITMEQPFKVVKENPAEGKLKIGVVVTELYWIAKMLKPFMPGTSEIIKTAILANKKPENLFPRL